MSEGSLKGMKGVQNDDIAYDQSKRAELTLAHVLENEIDEAAEIEKVIGKSLRSVSVKSERNADPVLDDTTSNRTMSRMLFITQDIDYLDPNSTVMTTMYKLAILFDEVHLMVLLPLRGKQSTKRMADNFWLYRAEAQNWLDLPNAALMYADEQLNFSDGFRPDFIVATDPFEAGQAAQLIGEAFDRFYQIHIKDNFLDRSFFRSSSFITRRAKLRMAKRVIKGAGSVCAGSNQIRAQLRKKYKNLKNILLLPQYHSYRAIMDMKPAFDVHQQYASGFEGVIAAFGPFSIDSYLNDTISALTPMLSSDPKLGLLLIGEGKGKDFLQDKVRKLGIKKNVIFLPKHIDTISILKTADVVVVTDTRAESESHVLSAAAAGAPMVMYETHFRLDMFSDGESASFCKSGDILALGGDVHALLNDQVRRTKYRDAAQQVIETRVEEDALKYFIALRDSLELTLVGDNDEETEVSTDNKDNTDEKK